jgi:hypothetical protein
VGETANGVPTAFEAEDDDEYEDEWEQRLWLLAICYLSFVLRCKRALGTT